MKVLFLSLLLLVLAGVGGVLVADLTGLVDIMSLVSPAPPAPSEEEELPGETMDVDTLSYELEARGASGESGTVILHRGEGSIEVTLEFSGIPEDASRQAGVYTGSCEALGELVSPLSPPVNGTSESEITRSPVEMRNLRQSSGMVVAVLASDEGEERVVACVDVLILGR